MNLIFKLSIVFLWVSVCPNTSAQQKNTSPISNIPTQSTPKSEDHPIAPPIPPPDDTKKKDK